MTVLATRRLILEPLGPGDLEALEAIFSDREHMWDLMDIPGRPEDPRGLARYYLDRSVWAFGRYGAGMWGLRPRAESGASIVGYTGLAIDIGEEVDMAGEVEAAWAVARDRTGEGFAAEAAGAVLDHLFGVLGVRRVAAVTSPDNRASRRLMERLGLARGEDTVAYQGPQVVYAIDREAWRGPPAPPSRGGRSCGR